MSLALTTGRRVLATDGSKYDYLFEAPVKDDVIIINDASVQETVKQMVKLVDKYHYQTSELASILQGSTIEESTRNIWNFIYSHIQYKEDQTGVEQLRTPARTWADRKSGVDCDCMSIFAGSLLKNMGIDYQFRIVAYGKPSNDFQHVYVIVPKPGINGRYIVIDGVLDAWNKELDYAKQQTFNGMNGIPLQILNGIDAPAQNDEPRLKEFLLKQREAIINKPDLLRVIHYQDALEWIDYVLKNYNDPQNRIQAITHLANTEAEYLPESFMFRTILAYYNGNATCEDVQKSAWIKFSSLGKGKNVWAQYGLAGPRAAYLALLSLNFAGWADKFVVGFFGGLNDTTKGTKEWEPNRAAFAARFGMSVADQKKNRDQLLKVLKMWHDKLGGDWDDFKRYTFNGSKKLHERAKDLPGYGYWRYFDDWGGKPQAANSNPVGLFGIGEHYEEAELNGTGLGSVEATLTAAAAVIAALAPIVTAFAKPGNSIVSPTDLALYNSTPLPPADSYTSSGDTTKWVLAGLGILAAGIGAYFAFFNKPTKKKSDGK